jgi:hypothetical protein
VSQFPASAWADTFDSSGILPHCSAGGRNDEDNPFACLFSLVYLTAKLDNLCMTEKHNPHAVALGKLGGKARAAKLTQVERSAIASKAGNARTSSLSKSERVRIAKLAVKAREDKRAKNTGKGDRK